MISHVLARSRARRRFGCSLSGRLGCSDGAARFCQTINEQIIAFDAEVREKIVVPIIAGYEDWFTGERGSGKIDLSYSEYSIGKSVSIKIIMPDMVGQLLWDEIKKRIHVHAYDFHWQKQSRSVYVDLLRLDGMLIEHFKYAPPSRESCSCDDD